MSAPISPIEPFSPYRSTLADARHARVTFRVHRLLAILYGLIGIGVISAVGIVCFFFSSVLFSTRPAYLTLGGKP